MPDLPALSEAALPGFNASQWWGALAPAKVPRDTVTRLNTEINRILTAEDVKSSLALEGAGPVLMSPEAFSATVKTEITNWRKLVKNLNISP
jgi:tripartite-type tricarboxylate transporter receptor subunit TctC